ncbi:hypothetical protein AWC04_02395 [Mycolicibacterium fallax]|uniref:DUF7847 domain-containing protein n=1 Tax=Mycolicibacterium fallax TaxID=1793 RepID=A0A1X1RKB3_MYCFA|nr:glycerophosphoryl diester phosphodiesterase membrane domain-containing protein [Mycolicibacterium fallax]ORV08118.1 hypothetical protein AWC04_02395 [Mycolicibacterium fallax]HOW93714.1 glycerophosphoryl diester phosphodiesterase membrane domain-containing protein [Mycolicibacterium fallax]
MPGIIPLRPLTLSELYNGAIGYIRRSPKATLGLTTIVIVGTQLLALVLQLGPLALLGKLDLLQDPDVDLVVSSLLQVPAALAGLLAGVLLGGMLTVVIGRAVFGSSITIAEAWERIRPRLPALIGLAALEFFGVLLVLAVVIALITALAAANTVVAVAVGLPLALAVLVGLGFLWVQLAFAPTAIVLERLPVMTAIRRSLTLVRGDFWRILGILVLTGIITGMIASALGFPFTFAGGLVTTMADQPGLMVLGAVLTAAGGSIGQIVASPFSAGVSVLLYTDRRMRAEAFDLVLRTGAAQRAQHPQIDPSADPTDLLWLTRR